MNVCIVTVYNTENCGSFWQARALAEVIGKMGHNVSFLYRSKSDTPHSFRVHLHECIAKASKLNFKASFLVWKRQANYKRAHKYFKIVTPNQTGYKDIDLFVIGSDTVWNFASAYFMRHSDIYTGAALGPEKCISYAASAANTPFEKFNTPVIKDAISNLKGISVRDGETYQIVKELTNRESRVVCDPTMLTERALFDRNVKNITDDNYILIYQFASIGEKQKKDILELKKKYNLKVISFGEHRSWCDKTICYDPYDFISYFKNASFVVTDTFHGTIFSILYEKKFAEYGNKKKKIADLLKSLQLTGAIKDENVSLIEMFNNGLDYTYAKDKIKSIRQDSLNYLQENLTER